MILALDNLSKAGDIIERDIDKKRWPRVIFYQAKDFELTIGIKYREILKVYNLCWNDIRRGMLIDCGTKCLCRLKTSTRNIQSCIVFQIASTCNFFISRQLDPTGLNAPILAHVT